MAQTRHSGNGHGPADRLKSEAAGLIGALGKRAVSSVHDRLQETTDRLTDYAHDGGGPGLMTALTGAGSKPEGDGPGSVLGAGFKGVAQKLGGGKGRGGDGKGKNLKVTNIVESIDVGMPLRVAYNQWTQFADFPSFMKKVESVESEEDGQKLNWKAQVLWSHRTWEAIILQQHPDERIVWRSKGAKGFVDGTVTFHELAPNLTRILVVLEYNPQGFFEHTGNIWRAQGRRARLELKHFRRHVMSQAILHPDEIEGWRGVIEDGEVVKDHETAVREEEGDGEPEDAQARDEGEPAEDEQEDFEEDDEDEQYDEDEEDEDEEDEDEPHDEDGERRNGHRTDRQRGARAPAAASRPVRGRRAEGGPRRSARSGRAH
jgi:Polyketide cyclase / dehydrase and lipid transport